MKTFPFQFAIDHRRAFEHDIQRRYVKGGNMSFIVLALWGVSIVWCAWAMLQYPNCVSIDDLYRILFSFEFWIFGFHTSLYSLGAMKPIEHIINTSQAKFMFVCNIYCIFHYVDMPLCALRVCSIFVQFHVPCELLALLDAMTPTIVMLGFLFLNPKNIELGEGAPLKP